MVDLIQHMVRAADAVIARAYLGVFRERNALMCFLFHSLFRNEQEMARNLVDPLERTTVATFRRLIEYYLEHGYRFISPQDLIAGIAADGKYALLTFDDGYYNNSLALPVLEEFNVPATFFISTNHVLQNKCYWWDVLYRERLAQGASPRKVYHEAIAMKSMRTEQIEAELISRFGPRALVPQSDIDRPFTPRELREFANHPRVRLGNHTANHAILTNYSADEVRRQISGAQEALQSMTGVTPTSIAYPNGAYDENIIGVCRSMGLQVGFNVRPAKNLLPPHDASTGLLRLNRFCPAGDVQMDSQCRTYRSDLLLYGLFRSAYLRIARRQLAH